METNRNRLFQVLPVLPEFRSWTTRALKRRRRCWIWMWSSSSRSSADWKTLPPEASKRPTRPNQSGGRPSVRFSDDARDAASPRRRHHVAAAWRIKPATTRIFGARRRRKKFRRPVIRSTISWMKTVVPIRRWRKSLPWPLDQTQSLRRMHPPPLQLHRNWRVSSYPFRNRKILPDFHPSN